MPESLSDNSSMQRLYVNKKFYTIHYQDEVLFLSKEAVLIPAQCEREAYTILSKLVQKLGITRAPLYLKQVNMVLYKP